MGLSHTSKGLREWSSWLFFSSNNCYKPWREPRKSCTRLCCLCTDPALVCVCVSLCLTPFFLSNWELAARVAAYRHAFVCVWPLFPNSYPSLYHHAAGPGMEDPRWLIHYRSPPPSPGFSPQPRSQRDMVLIESSESTYREGAVGKGASKFCISGLSSVQ